MKKTIALLLALLFVLALFACGKADTKPADTTPSDKQDSAPADNKDDDKKDSDAAPAGDEYGSDQTLASGFGLFRDDFDYSSMKKFKVVGMFQQMNAMYQALDEYFNVWGKKTNCDYSTFDAGNDSDAFINTIETYAGQGVDGVIITPDSSVMPRVVEVLDECGMNYMPGFSPAVNNANEYTHPFVGTDNYAIGETLGGWLADYAKSIGATTEDSGLVWVDWSTSNEVHLRGIGLYEAWDAKLGNAKEVFHYVDGVSEGSMGEEAGYNLISTLVVANPNVKHWFIGTTAENMTFGCVRALEDYKLDEGSAVVNNGVDSVVKQWDTETYTCFRAGNAIPVATRTNAYWNALYAFMAGWATPESIWPDCTPEGETYAYVVLNPNMVTPEDYQNFLAWGDALIGYDKYGYKWDGTEYEAYSILDHYPLLWTQITEDPINGQFNKN